MPTIFLIYKLQHGTGFVRYVYSVEALLMSKSVETIPLLKTSRLSRGEYFPEFGCDTEVRGLQRRLAPRGQERVKGFC